MQIYLINVLTDGKFLMTIRVAVLNKSVVSKRSITKQYIEF